MLKRMLPITLLSALVAGIGLTSAASATLPTRVGQNLGSQNTYDPQSSEETSGPSKLPVDTIDGRVNIQAGGGTWELGYVNGCRIANIYVGLPAGWPVTASVTEVDPYGNEFIGGARAGVNNVAVLSNGFVDAHYCIGFDRPLRFHIHLVWG